MQASVAYTPTSFPPPQQCLDERTSGKLTGGGVLLFLSGLAVAGTGFANLRPSVFGLHVHPYLIPIGLAFPFLLVSRIHKFPTNTLFGMLIFTSIYIFSTLISGLGSPETPKILVGMITIVVAALLIRSRADFIAGALGLSIAVGILSFRGLTAEGDAAAGAIDLTNKNAFSLFALPATFFSCFIALNYDTKQWVKAILLLTAIASTVAIFSSQNRSGYLGIMLIGLMLLRNRKFFGLLLVLVIATAATVAISKLGTADVAQARIERTFEGNIDSDRDRLALFLTSLQIGLENPIIGVSPEGLTFELARRVMPKLPYVDPHNVFASVFGGCGIICFSALLYTGWSICNILPAKRIVDEKDMFYRQSRSLARMLVILWCVRGLFTREILYNPSFCLALGMVIGLCLVASGRTQLRDHRRHDVAVAPS